MRTSELVVVLFRRERGLRPSALTSMLVSYTLKHILKEIRAPNFQNHDFEIMVDPKGSSNEANFWSSFEAPDPYLPAWWPYPFWPQNTKTI